MAGFGITVSDNNLVQGNTVTGSGWFGIEIRGGQNNVISSNVVKRNGLGGIVAGAGAFNFLAQCAVDGNGNPTNCGIRFPLSEGDALHNLISDNEGAYNQGPGILIGGTFTDFQGLVRVARQNSVIHNQIYANDGLGIDLSDAIESVYFAAEEPLLGAFGEIVLAKPDGPTANDQVSVTNDGLNFPVLHSALLARGRLEVNGKIIHLIQPT